MRTLKAWHLTATCIAAFATPLLAQAQQADAPPPPQMQKLEEGEAPAVTIRKPDQERKITEKRARGGKVTETKVTSGKSTYYLKPNEQPGAMPGDGQSSANRGAQWQVKEFDLSRKQEATTEQAASIPAPPPAPAKK
ncbi:DUF2782 domain-containing protein [Noviherbaspirillum sp. UKPF54]|uniref:DUF2782 domain-containing protein n=1 Tax=Noviherbaspirillum sp. UKPF54 TaxID=2601898 RepID=UPI0011B1AEC8|nr:DUF2782 domain-containing protein [Noviherbaspirillum sp. UKPF54]QDZ30333.1 DUF2782 domain-containing protein [Noviherbaspirillum sp. UKPF54]